MSISFLMAFIITCFASIQEKLPLAILNITQHHRGKGEGRLR
jgi:hypothetical protein